jgi:MerR HTH family regulatory protein
MPARGYSRAAVCAKVGLRPRQVVDWAEKRVVRPEIADPIGAGKPRLYSDDNLIEFVLASELVGVGLTVRGAARFLRFLRTRPPTFLRSIGALRLARTRDGRLHVTGLSPRAARHWEVLASARRSPRPPDDVVLSVVLDLDAARRRLKS